MKSYKDKSVYFLISDSSVAKLKKADKGTVTVKALKDGIATLTIRTEKAEYKCRITIVSASENKNIFRCANIV